MTNSRVAEVVGCNGGTVFKQELDKAEIAVSLIKVSRIDIVGNNIDYMVW